MFNRELDVLHILVVLFENITGFFELLVDNRILLCKLGDWHWCTNTSNNILALCIHQVLTKDDIFTCGCITCERNTGTTVITTVAKDHCLDVDSRSNRIINLFLATIDDGALVVPRAENGSDCRVKLLMGILWELLTSLLNNVGLVIITKALQALSRDFQVFRYTELGFEVIEHMLKVVLGDVLVMIRVSNIGQHHNEPTIGVVHKSRISNQRQGIYDLIVQAEVEDGVHHSWHRESCTTSNGQQERIVRVTERFAEFLFNIRESGLDFVNQTIR